MFVWRTVKASSKKIKSQEYIPSSSETSQQGEIEVNKIKLTISSDRAVTDGVPLFAFGEGGKPLEGQAKKNSQAIAIKESNNKQ